MRCNLCGTEFGTPIQCRQHQLGCTTLTPPQLNNSAAPPVPRPVPATVPPLPLAHAQAHNQSSPLEPAEIAAQPLCAICGSTAPSVCSLCKKVRYCSRDHQVSVRHRQSACNPLLQRMHWKHHKLTCSGQHGTTSPRAHQRGSTTTTTQLQTVRRAVGLGTAAVAVDKPDFLLDLGELLRGCAGTRDRFGHALHTHGFAVLETEGFVPVGDSMWDYSKLITAVYQGSRTFFDRPHHQKMQYAVGGTLAEQQGYAHLAQFGYEAFETRNVTCPGWQYPAELETAVKSTHMLLRHLSQTLLSSLAGAMGLQEDTWTQLLDTATDLNLANCSNTALKISHYIGEPTARGTFASAHADTSLLTIAPRGSRAGLKVKRVTDGEWMNIEKSIGPNQILVFAGDLLSRATHGYIPSLLHVPCAPETEQHKGGQKCRISMPYFVRPRPDALIETCGSELVEQKMEGVPAVTMGHLTRNSHLKDEWPWKLSSYYTTSCEPPKLIGIRQ